MTPIDVTGLREEAAAQAAAEAPAPFVAPLAAEANRTAQAPTLEAITAEDLKPVAELKKQRAPLADASKGKKSPAERLRAQIPSIESFSQGPNGGRSDSSFVYVDIEPERLSPVAFRFNHA